MTREWKVGDRFSVEGVITAAPDCDGDYQAIFDGHTTGGCVLAAEMQHAKLIQPAATEPQKLDVTKPMRCRGGCTPISYLATDQFGRIWIQNNEKQVLCLDYSDLENIPEPKITGRREAALLSNGVMVWADFPQAYDIRHVVGRKTVEITEGDGMGGEE